MNTDLRRFARGFVYAWNGLRKAVAEERNFRFHLCAAGYAIAAGCLAELNRTEFSVLFLCIFTVLGMEMMNSAVERAVDKPDNTHWWSAGTAKDMAAGAVLVTALGSLAVAFCLFAHPHVLSKIWSRVVGSPCAIILLLLSFLLAFFFVFRYGTHKEGGGDENAG